MTAAPDRPDTAAEVDGNDVAIEDVRAIAVALGLGGHARPYSAHEVVQREILPALAARRPATEAEQLCACGPGVQALHRYGSPECRNALGGAARDGDAT